ncbi:hypothetical protein [Mucilaginibacter sp. L196]|uniref:hypothetical protein n=1 Tax=Mucilaginibacter sp. L196 TaxID=1641870 RepID=UPI00131B5832|nr:hypothetical protein [Mucilaginibacter sp. L196]
MYSNLLAIHSLIRWMVVGSLFFSIFRAYYGWLLQRPFTRYDNLVRHWTATIAHIQLIVGLWLYIISPIVAYFLGHIKTAMQERAIRFFGIEHITMMLIGIILITLGSARAKRETTDKEKFKTIAIWYTIGALVILSSVPWSFSPVVSRPNFRPF